MSKQILYDDVEKCLLGVAANVEPTDTVLDVGVGIVPMNYFRPKLHIMIEPYEEYVHILQYRHADDKSILVLQGSAQDMMPHLTPNSIDSIFMLDLIEHLPKEDGFVLLRHAERVARRQIVVFTPLGFMPQHARDGEADAWGLSGGEFQEHISGWLPEDFAGGWELHICKTFHRHDFRNELLEKPHGAFFAIRNFYDKPLAKPETLCDFRKPLPSEIELSIVRSQLTQCEVERTGYQVQLDQTQKQFTETQAQLAEAQLQLSKTSAALTNAMRTFNHPVVRATHKVWRLISRQGR